VTSKRKNQICLLLKGIETGDPASNDGITIQYDENHRLLAEGNFVLSVSEGFLGGVHTSFYDLFRVSNGKLVEHWDTVDEIPPRSEWKNENGKF